MITEQERSDLNSRFSHHPPINIDVGNAFGMVRGQMLRAAELVMQLCPGGREKSLAITHLEEAMFWANASIARNQEDSAARYMALPKVSDARCGHPE